MLILFGDGCHVRDGYMYLCLLLLIGSILNENVFRGIISFLWSFGVKGHPSLRFFSRTINPLTSDLVVC